MHQVEYRPGEICGWPAACSLMTAWRSSKICEPQSRFGDSFSGGEKLRGRNIQGDIHLVGADILGVPCKFASDCSSMISGYVFFRPLVTKGPGRGTPFKDLLTQDLHEQSLEMTGSPVSTSRIFLLYLNLILRVILSLHLPNISPETSRL